MNAEAWRIYHQLHGRVVAECDLRGYLLERVTEDWPLDDVLDVLKRLDVIVEVLETNKT